MTAALALAGAAGAHAAPGGATVKPTACLLRAGAHGHKVVVVQRALHVRADGAFGPATAAALTRFQRSHRLALTGCLDGATRAALGLSPKPAAATVSLSRSELMALQRALGVTPDGALGPVTRAAIRKAEARAGLPVDGVPSMQLLTWLGVQAAPASAPPGSHAAAVMLHAALSKVGSSYAWGATGPNSFDCSGLVMWAAKRAGVIVPRTTYAQYETGTAVAADTIRPGDLVFFNTGGPGPSHVGIAVDATHAVSATSHGVREHETFDSYWGAHFLGARRLG